jgi:hypothetical protein
MSNDTRTPDDVVTALTRAPSRADAVRVMNGVGPALAQQVADLLYVEYEGHGTPWVRRECVNEARAGMDRERARDMHDAGVPSDMAARQLEGEARSHARRPR